MKKHIKYIAEISSNHNSNLQRCKKLIDICSKSGFDSVKFQLFKIEKLFHSSILKKSKKHRDRVKWELNENYISTLYKYSKKKGLNFGCTPFYIEAVEILRPYVDFYKIASYEILREDLFIKCINTKKHIIFSTGMANKDEIVKILNLFKKKKFNNFSVMACSSIYPTKPSESNLKTIESLRKLLSQHGFNNIKVGWSDHTCHPAVIYRAFHKFDIELLEAHIDLDGKGVEFNFKHCWLPNQIAEIISNVKSGFISDGKANLIPRKREAVERNWRSDPADGLRPLKKIRPNK